MSVHFSISEINGSAAFGRSGGVFLNKEKLLSSVMDVPGPEDDEMDWELDPNDPRMQPLDPNDRLANARRLNWDARVMSGQA